VAYKIIRMYGETKWGSREAIVAATKPPAGATSVLGGSTLRSRRWIVVVTERSGISLVEYGEARGLSIVPKRRAFKLASVVMEIKGRLRRGDPLQTCVASMRPRVKKIKKKQKKKRKSETKNTLGQISIRYPISRDRIDTRGAFCSGIADIVLEGHTTLVVLTSAM